MSAKNTKKGTVTESEVILNFAEEFKEQLSHQKQLGIIQTKGYRSFTIDALGEKRPVITKNEALALFRSADQNRIQGAINAGLTQIIFVDPTSIFKKEEVLCEVYRQKSMDNLKNADGTLITDVQKYHTYFWLSFSQEKYTYLEEKDVQPHGYEMYLVPAYTNVPPGADLLSNEPLCKRGELLKTEGYFGMTDHIWFSLAMLVCRKRETVLNAINCKKDTACALFGMRTEEGNIPVIYFATSTDGMTYGDQVMINSVRPDNVNYDVSTFRVFRI